MEGGDSSGYDTLMMKGRKFFTTPTRSNEVEDGNYEIVNPFDDEDGNYKWSDEVEDGNYEIFSNNNNNIREGNNRNNNSNDNNTNNDRENEKILVLVDFPNMWKNSQLYADFKTREIMKPIAEEEKQKHIEMETIIMNQKNEDIKKMINQIESVIKNSHKNIETLKKEITKPLYRRKRNPYFFHAQKLSYFLPTTCNFQDAENSIKYIVASKDENRKYDPKIYSSYQGYWRVNLSDRFEGTTQKEVVDSYIIVLGMSHCNNVHKLVLASGDCDFWPLVEHFYNMKKKIEIWAFKNTVKKSYIDKLKGIDVKVRYLDKYCWSIGFIKEKEWVLKKYGIEITPSENLTHYEVSKMFKKTVKNDFEELGRKYIINWKDGLKICFEKESDRYNFLNNEHFQEWCTKNNKNYASIEIEEKDGQFFSVDYSGL